MCVLDLRNQNGVARAATNRVLDGGVRHVGMGMVSSNSLKSIVIGDESWSGGAERHNRRRARELGAGGSKIKRNSCSGATVTGMILGAAQVQKSETT